MRFFTADLHLHTVLSACAELEMFPDLIVERGQELGIEACFCYWRWSKRRATAFDRKVEIERRLL